MNTATTEITEETEQQAESRKRFECQEQEFREVESKISTLRKWINDHAELLAPFKWNAMMHHIPTICFFSFPSENRDPKQIARAFGADGWKREKDSFKCGTLNWVKNVDGVKLEICEAEVVKFNPISDVKL